MENPEVMSKRARAWRGFSEEVVAHIENYTVPQYGDLGCDIATGYTAEYCVSQVEKYMARFGRNMRPGQQRLDLLKAAHYLQMAAAQLEKGQDDGH